MLGGENRLETFLHPSFVAHGSEASVGEEAPASESEPPGSGSLELRLMAISVAVALAGIGLAYVLFLKRRGLAERLAGRFPGVHRVLLHKYYVDEIYDGAIVQPIRIVATDGLWRGVDAGFIDGAVNGVGTVVQGFSAGLRRVQTGSVRGYAAWLLIGVLVIMGYYLWR